MYWANSLADGMNWYRLNRAISRPFLFKLRSLIYGLDLVINLLDLN